MSTRRLLMTLLGTSVSVFVLTSHSAYAGQQPFTPVTGWTVNRVDPANGSAAYCTLARRFSGNTIITFARNTGGEGTIAVDFQQPLFSTDETYRIGLQAGDGMKRDFMTRPATTNALVLRTGQDPAFFTALAGSTELGVIMDDHRYAFELPDFADGSSQLSGCLGKGGNAVAPDAVASGDGAAAPAVALPDDGKLAQMRSELEKLRQENAGIVASLKEQTAEAKPAQQSPESNQLMGQLNSLEEEKNGLVEKLQAGQQQQMQDVSELKSALEDQKSMKQMLESERAQRQELEQALTTKTAEAEKRGEMRARIDQLEASNKDLKALRDAVDTERSKRIAAEDALKAQASASLEQQETVRARMAVLETKNKTLQQSADQLEATRTRLEDTTSRASQEQARREAAEGALKDMAISISKREADMEALQAKVEVERKKMEAAEGDKEAQLTKQHADEMARLNAQIEDMKTDQAKEMADRESLTGKVSAEQARREAAEQAVRDMQLSISKREADMVALQAKVDAERTQMEDAAKSRDAELSRKHADELARLNAQMEDAKKAQKDEIQAREELSSKVATEQARREAAEKTVSELQNEIGAERTKLADAASAKEAALIKQHQDEIARLNAELDKTKTAQNTEVEKARADVETAKAAADDLQAKIAAEAARREAAEKTVSELQSQIADERVKLTSTDDLKTKMATEAARREAAEKAMAEYQNKVDSERQQLTKAESDKESELAKKHQDEIAKLNEELSLIKSAQAAEIQKAETEASTETARREATEKELQQTQAQLADVQTKAKSGDTQISAKLQDMQSQMKDLEQRNASLMSDLKTAQSTTQTAEATVARTESKSSGDADAKIAAISAKADADKKELQAMLEAEQQRREKIEGMMASGSSDDARMKIMGDRMNELQKQNQGLQQKLAEEKTSAAKIANSASPAAGGDAGETDALKKQLAALKSDNEMLAQKLASTASAPQAANAIDIKPVEYKGDGKMANDLAETQSSLASVMAERDEYRDLLQRERMKPATDKSKGSDAKDPGAVAQIKQLEAERADLVRQLEYERSRLEQVAAGKESAPAATDKDIAANTPAAAPAAPLTSDKSDALEKQLAEVTSQKAALEKQLEVTQNDVIAARQMAKKGAVSNNTGINQADVAALLSENKKLQTELAASNSQSGDGRAMETEITALRAQNKILNDEINKRLAAAPAQATIDNAQAKAEYATHEAKTEARQEVAVALNKANTRLAETDAENIRLSRELAKARKAPPVVVASAPQAVAPVMPVQSSVQASMPVMRAPVTTQPSQSAVYTPASLGTAQTQSVPGPDGHEIASDLQRAGISMVSGFEKINKVATASFAAFRWDTGVVFGTAEQERIGNEKAFKDAVTAYMEKTRNRCSGTFDQSVADGASNNTDFTTADVACIMPDGTGAGAAMLFFYKDGMFNAVAHEGTLDTFDQAMATRDKLAGFIKGQL